MKRQWLMITLILTLLGTGFTFSGWQSRVKEGNQNLQNGNLDPAVTAYQQALVDAPDEPVVHYNLGSALYAQGDYAGAQEHFNKTMESKESTLQTQAEYNLGNTLYRQGTGLAQSNPTEAINLYEGALQHYQNVMKADPADQDAKYNYELVKRKLEELKDQLENQEQDNQSNDSSDGQEQEEDQNGNENHEGQQSDQQQDQQGTEDEGQQEQSQDDGNAEEDEQQANEEDAAGADQSDEDVQAAEGEEGENLEGLTEAQALQLLEQFEDQVGQWIPVPVEEDKTGRVRKDW